MAIIAEDRKKLAQQIRKMEIEDAIAPYKQCLTRVRLLASVLDSDHAELAAVLRKAVTL